MLERLRRLQPFQTPETQRLAILFAVVYFAQGMWSLPNQTLIITLKGRGLSAGQVATFFSFSVVPWLIKPAYGLLSDFVPLFGQRRRPRLRAGGRRRPGDVPRRAAELLMARRTLHRDGTGAGIHRRPGTKPKGSDAEGNGQIANSWRSSSTR